jgi:hypothetical protein
MTLPAQNEQDVIAEALGEMASLAAEIGDQDDAFAEKLGPLVTDAQRIGEKTRRVLWGLRDKQELALRGAASTVESTLRAAASTGPRVDPALLAQQRTVALRAAEHEAAKSAIASLGPEVLGGALGDGTTAPGLAQQAATAGATLEKAVGQSKLRWRSGLGRPKEVGDLVEKERVRAVLASKSAEELAAFVEATIEDGSDEEFAMIDEVARLRAIALLEQPARTSAALRARTASAPAALIARQVIDRLDRETEKRMPRSITAADDALGLYRDKVYRALVGPNVGLMDQTEYRALRAGGDSALARVLASWQTDSTWASRYMKPRPFVIPGWSPIVGRDAASGNPIRSGSGK